MRYSVLAASLVLGACSADSPSEPVNLNVPTNPLVSLLATQSATYALTQLGSQTAPPFMTWDAVCNDLRWRHEYADTIYFKGDGSYSRVYHYWLDGWQTIGVPEPEPRRGHYSNELSGSISGEGDLLKLSLPNNNVGFTGFEILGAALVKSERIGTGCVGGGTMVNAVYTRIPE